MIDLSELICYVKSPGRKPHHVQFFQELLEEQEGLFLHQGFRARFQ